ncbi:MAG: class I SAM-dependent methyltransferase [Flavobacteriaceae bacterium]|nr:class I SAM-dependent methyltransferase [Flavobacteriaceae bacterium]
MIQSDIFNSHVEEYEAWYEKHNDAYLSEVAAVKEQFLKLPENLRGIEVGLGTGRFAEPLGIKEGIEPAMEMAKIAMNRDIEIMKGVAEHLPYAALQFDFVLFVTICHLDNVKEAFAEAHRVLKNGGSIIVGFLDKDQSVAKQYEDKRGRSTFFKHAIFYSVDRVENLLKEAGFRNFEYNQSLFGKLDQIKEVQVPKQGYGEGSFVVVKADK